MKNKKLKIKLFKKALILTTNYQLLTTLFLSPVYALETNIDEALDKEFFQIEIGVFISKGVDAAIVVGALLCLGYLLWGGIDWLVSGGDKAKYEEARNKIMHAVIGLVIVTTVWVIWKLILHFLGIGIEEGGELIIKQ